MDENGGFKEIAALEWGLIAGKISACEKEAQKRKYL